MSDTKKPIELGDGDGVFTEATVEMLEHSKNGKGEDDE